MGAWGILERQSDHGFKQLEIVIDDVTWLPDQRIARAVLCWRTLYRG